VAVPLAQPHQFSQRPRIADCMAADVIVEVEIGGRELRFPGKQAIGPLAEMSPGIVAAISRPAAVKTNIGEIGSELLRPEHFPPIVNAICNVVARQQIVNLRYAPAFIAELDGVPVTARQNT